MYASFSARAVGLPDLPAMTTIEIAAAAGFAAIDLVIHDLIRSDVNLDEIRTRMDDRGLRAGAFPIMMNWRGDEASFRRDLAELPRIARAASALGFCRTGTWVMPETPAMPPAGVATGSFRAEIAAFHVDRVGAIARVLADHGIQIGLEVIGVATFRRGVGVEFVTRLGELSPILDGLRLLPNVGLVADVWHLYAAGENLDAALSWGADRVVWAHVAGLPRGGTSERSNLIDHQRGLPQPCGAIDSQGFLAMLADAGYLGPVMAEPLGECADLSGEPPIEIARRVKRSLDQCWPAGC